ncbi:MAG: UDP-N-acetylmuramoyl-L-alanine--D-glutamate ligase [Nitrospirota bacterium]
MNDLRKTFNERNGFKGKKITVVGAARSGVSASNLLVSKGADVTITDIKEAVHLRTYLERLDKRVKTSLGRHQPDIFTNVDMIVISPGVPMGIGPLSIAIRNNIPVISELELAYNSIDVPFIAITGTNGKSTTTMLIREILKGAGLNVFVGGNIGNALCDIFSTLNSQLSTLNYVVAEVSSFQLEGVKDFKPHIACILNITPDHLDRYKDMDEYMTAKSRIFTNQDKNDFLILNADDPLTCSLTRRACSNIVLFSRYRQQARKNTPLVCLNGEEIIYKSSGKKELICSLNELRIKGIHNIENAMAAVAASMLTGISLESVRKTLREFDGLEHRIEFVSEIDGVAYINDSKGTNVGAVEKSILSFTAPVILIAGGLDKGGEFTLLRETVRERVKAMVLIGEARDKIKAALGDLVDTCIADSMSEAVKIASVLSVKGDVVLLSPACASFDMFKDYEDRGRQFKESVKNLKGMTEGFNV